MQLLQPEMVEALGKEVAVEMEMEKEEVEGKKDQ